MAPWRRWGTVLPGGYLKLPLDAFFEPDAEILIARSSDEAVAILARDRASLEKIAAQARQRALDCHTAEIRAMRLIALLESSQGSPESVGDLALVAERS